MPSEPVAFKPWTPIPVQHTIPDPSPAFEAFLHEYFVNPWGPTRREEDLKLFKKLTAAELEEAKRLIEEHLGDYDWFVRLAGVLKMHSVVPKLRELLAEGRRSTSDVSWALLKLGGLTPREACEIWKGLAAGEEAFEARFGLSRAAYELPVPMAAEVVEVGLRSPLYWVRNESVRMLVVLEDTASHSRRSSAARNERIVIACDAWTERPADGVSPSRMKMFVGDEVFADPSLFRLRINELTARLHRAASMFTSRGRRKVPLRPQRK